MLCCSPRWPSLDLFLDESRYPDPSASVLCNGNSRSILPDGVPTPGSGGLTDLAGHFNVRPGSKVVDFRQHGRPGRFVMELQCLSKIVKSITRRLTLAGNVNLQGLGHKPSVLGPDNGCELHVLHKGIPELSDVLLVLAKQSLSSREYYLHRPGPGICDHVS